MLQRTIITFLLLAQTTANIFGQNVSPLTGDFSYGLPLLTVPGPNGEQYPLSLSYSAGIGMEQQASVIGLGWSVNLPAIQRNVNGNPDDFVQSDLGEFRYFLNGSTMSSIFEQSELTGAANYCFVDEGNTSPGIDFADNSKKNRTNMDISQSYRAGFGFAPAEMPAYDGYSFTGGLSGSFKPAYCYVLRDEINQTIQDGTVKEHPLELSYNYDVLNNIQLYPGDPGYVDFPGGVRFFHKELNMEGGKYKTYWGGPEPRDYSFHSGVEEHDLAFLMGDDFEQNTVIEFFRNGELASGYPAGFIEVDGWTTTNRAALPPHGIGAFRVTDANGMTYHFSLHVYAQNEKYIQVALKDPGTAPHLSIFDKIGAPHEGDTLRVTERNGKYAYEWKLIAITGPGYRDGNISQAQQTPIA